MIRKITKNLHQYKINVPVELIRKLGWNEKREINLIEVSTKLGKGILIVDENSEPINLEVK